MLHGPPGVGKTELVRVLAQALGMRLYEVGTANSEGSALRPRERFDASVFNQRLFAADGRALVLFDEFEDVFPDPYRALEASKGSGCDKAWINRLLETNPVPTFWIANRISHLDPAYLRRFDYVLEMRNPPRSVRAKVLQLQLKDLPVGAPWLARYADDARITPALTAKAARIVRGATPGGAGETERQLEHVFKSYLDAQGASSKGHYAASIRFRLIGSAPFLRVLPSYSFTKDGYESLDHRQAGRYRVIWGGKQDSAAVLRHVLFWLRYLSTGREDIVLETGGDAFRISMMPATAPTRVGIGMDHTRIKALIDEPAAGEDELDAVADSTAITDLDEEPQDETEDFEGATS